MSSIFTGSFSKYGPCASLLKSLIGDDGIAAGRCSLSKSPGVSNFIGGQTFDLGEGFQSFCAFSPSCHRFLRREPSRDPEEPGA